MKRIMVYVYLLVIGVLFILFYLNLPYSQRSLSVLLLIPIFFLIFHFFLFLIKDKRGISLSVPFQSVFIGICDSVLSIFRGFVVWECNC